MNDEATGIASFRLDEKFQRHHMVSLSAENLQQRLSELGEVLNRHFKSLQKKSEKDAFAAGMEIIEALRRGGHDLWSWGYDGTSVESWGPDYMKDDKVHSLFLQIHRNWTIKCNWIEKCADDGELIFLLGVCGSVSGGHDGN